VGVHYADHLGADLLQLLPHVRLQVNWTPHDDLAACTQGMANMMAALVRRHADVVTSVADRIKMVRALVAWFVEAERAPSGESTPDRELRDKVGSALEALLGEGEGATDPLDLWHEVAKYDRRAQWLPEEDARVQDNLAEVIRTERLLPPEHPFLALQPPAATAYAATPMDQDDGWSVYAQLGGNGRR
jgi:predicted RecB family endonuclease